ncbi:phospholipase D family protein [Marinobacter sp. ATCH36]|nr:phospholipase D family protein [Marinobacter sp. ATCH36]
MSESQLTRLGKAIAPKLSDHPGKSGIYALTNPRDAFAARILLARVADRTLDVQYYIWHGDITGTLLLEELHTAADRGVRVRLLVDDNGTSGIDTELAALALHPLIEIRLFNPFVVRSPKWLGYLTDFSRANRRMHNKSFTADNQASIIGGRNVGDEYFGATGGVLFADLDVLSVGPVVADVSADFDRYWASDSAYPIDNIVSPVSEMALDQLSTRASLIERDSAASAYVNAISESEFIEKLLENELKMEWARARMVSDDPAKGLGLAEKKGLLTHQLGEILGAPESQVALVSPYFVPTEAGVEVFSALAARGIEVSILTNSLDATDVAAVHAGYAKRRKTLLEAGIRLFEMRRLSPEVNRNLSAGPFGSSGSSLHAKTFAVDGERMFVGSFNFDPRSFNLNTELGFVIESPVLAQNVHRAFETAIPRNAYEVRIDDDGDLYWLERVGDREVRHEKEPATGFLKRTGVLLLSILPIEWLL